MLDEFKKIMTRSSGPPAMNVLIIKGSDTKGNIKYKNLIGQELDLAHAYKQMGMTLYDMISDLDRLAILSNIPQKGPQLHQYYTNVLRTEFQKINKTTK